MTTRYFNPVIDPAAPMQVKLTARVRHIQYGDGYSEDSPDGINNTQRTADLHWLGEEDDIGSIYAFLSAEMSWGRIRYTLPGDLSRGLWLCTSLSRTRRGSGLSDLSATLEEVYL